MSYERSPIFRPAERWADAMELVKKFNQLLEENEDLKRKIAAYEGAFVQVRQESAGGDASSVSHLPTDLTDEELVQAGRW